MPDPDDWRTVPVINPLVERLVEYDQLSCVRIGWSAVSGIQAVPSRRICGRPPVKANSEDMLLSAPNCVKSKLPRQELSTWSWVENEPANTRYDVTSADAIGTFTNSASKNAQAMRFNTRNPFRRHTTRCTKVVSISLVDRLDNLA